MVIGCYSYNLFEDFEATPCLISKRNGHNIIKLYKRAPVWMVIGKYNFFQTTMSFWFQTHGLPWFKKETPKKPKKPWFGFFSRCFVHQMVIQDLQVTFGVVKDLSDLPGPGVHALQFLQRAQNIGKVVISQSRSWSWVELVQRWWVEEGIPSGYVKIAIENGHRNSEFSHL